MSIADDFELSRFISLPIDLMGWARYFYDDTEFIQSEIVRFAYKCPMAEDVDELRVSQYVIKFDGDTINVELELDTNINLPGKALLLNPDEKDL